MINMKQGVLINMIQGVLINIIQAVLIIMKISLRRAEVSEKRVCSKNNGDF